MNWISRLWVIGTIRGRLPWVQLPDTVTECNGMLQCFNTPQRVNLVIFEVVKCPNTPQHVDFVIFNVVRCSTHSWQHINFTVFDPVCFNTPQHINFANFDMVRCFNTICREFIYQYYDFWLKTCAKKPAPVMPVGFHKYMSSPKKLGVTLLGTRICHALWWPLLARHPNRPPLVAMNIPTEIILLTTGYGPHHHLNGTEYPRTIPTQPLMKSTPINNVVRNTNFDDPLWRTEVQQRQLTQMEHNHDPTTQV